MTEAEWLAATEPRDVVDYFWHRAGDRKLRLFALACNRTTPLAGRPVEFVEQLQAQWAVAERFADDHATVAELQKHWPVRPYYIHSARTWPETPRDWAGSYYACEIYPTLAEKVAFVHCLAGNPFRPGALNPRWRTADALGLAQAIYEDRAFDHLPILADALMDAGCDDEQVIGHCRSEGPHVRGCWVVDLVLGKE